MICCVNNNNLCVDIWYGVSVILCIYIYIYVYIYIYILKYLCMYMYVCICMYVYVGYMEYESCWWINVLQVWCKSNKLWRLLWLICHRKTCVIFPSKMSLNVWTISKDLVARLGGMYFDRQIPTANLIWTHRITGSCSGYLTWHSRTNKNTHTVNK